MAITMSTEKMAMTPLPPGLEAILFTVAPALMSSPPVMAMTTYLEKPVVIPSIAALGATSSRAEPEMTASKLALATM